MFIAVDAYPGLEFQGNVMVIGAAAASQFALIPPNNASGNFTKVTQRIPLRISIKTQENEQGLYLRPGMSVKIKIRTEVSMHEKPRREFYGRRAIHLFPSLAAHHPAYPWFVLRSQSCSSTFMVVLDWNDRQRRHPNDHGGFLARRLSQVVLGFNGLLSDCSVGFTGDFSMVIGAFRIEKGLFARSYYFRFWVLSLCHCLESRCIDFLPCYSRDWRRDFPTPVGMILFTNEFKKENRTVALGFYSIAIAAAISLGPSVGGYLIQAINWKWIFLINLPFGALTLLMGWVILKRTFRKIIHSFDLWGLVTLIIFLVALFVWAFPVEMLHGMPKAGHRHLP